MSNKKKSPIKVHKSIRPVVEKALETGWSVEWSKGGHLKLTHPCGALTFVSATPSDPRTVKNAESNLRRLLRVHGGSK